MDQQPHGWPNLRLQGELLTYHNADISMSSPKNPLSQVTMSFDLNDFSQLRPYLYHLTRRENLHSIKQYMQLESASRLADAAGKTELIRERRTSHVRLPKAGNDVVLCDQAKLHKANIQFSPGWEFDDFLQHLNTHVFFWAGSENKPVAHGVRHFNRYHEEAPVIIRIPIGSLLRKNSSAVPLFCKFNSGSPRCAYGKRSPRGSDTFVSAETCTFTAGHVVEVVFRDFVFLPQDLKISNSIAGEWGPLFSFNHG
jgi:hypothetical protein